MCPLTFWTFAFALWLKLEPCRLKRMQFLVTLFAFPKLLAAQTGLVRFQFTEQTFHRLVERSDEIAPGFLAVQRSEVRDQKPDDGRKKNKNQLVGSSAIRSTIFPRV